MRNIKPGTIRTLKPSLVEWKPVRYSVRSLLITPLKPSLVEWKPRFGTDSVPVQPPLKPSLVEWKHGFSTPGPSHWRHLETFLSGMETRELAVVLLRAEVP